MNMSNFNQQNKLIKIDGEYVKLYVTTNSTLPKLLKNTGSLVVLNKYNKDILSNENYLYLGNELIAGGWGLYTKTDRDKTQQFLKDYNHLYYVLTGIDNLKNTSFWDDETQLNTILSEHKNSFINNIKSKNFLYSLPELLNDCLNQLYNQTSTNPYILQNSDISESDLGLKITQYWNLADNIIKTQEISTKYLPYLFSPAIYYKPSLNNYNVEIEFGYFNRANRQFTNFAIAPKIEGKYLVPKGAFITKITIYLNINLNDASSIYQYSYDSCYTKYNRNNIGEYINFENNIENLFNKIENSIFSKNNNRWNSINNVFTYEYKNVEQKFGTRANSTIELNLINSYNQIDNNYLLICDDCTILKNLKLYYTGTTESKFKQYPALQKSYNAKNIQLKSLENILTDDFIDLDININIKCVDICRTNSYIIDSGEFSNNYNFLKLFDYYEENNNHLPESNNNKNAIGIFNNKINIPINFNIETNKALVTFIALPINKIIKSIYINKTVYENNIIIHNNVTGLLKHLNNCKIFGSCTPTTSSTNYICANPIDSSNVFAQPFTLYCIITYIDSNQIIESFDVNLGENLYYTYNLNYSFTHYIFGKYAQTYLHNNITNKHDENLEKIFEYNNKYLNWKAMNKYDCALIDTINDDYDGSHIFNLNIMNIEKDINPYLYTMSSIDDDGLDSPIINSYLKRINGY